MEAPAAPRAVTLDEAMALAIQYMRRGHVREADEICRRVLEVEPEHPDALHYSGMLAYRNGQIGEAVALMRKSLQLAPAQADWHSNLGIALQAQEDLEGAIDAFRRALAIEPRHGNAHSNLGVLLRVVGRLEEAETHQRTAIELNPNHADAYHNLAILLDQTNRTPEALTAYCKAITLKPAHPSARRMLALAYYTVGERDKAIEVCEQWVASAPDDPRARHALAAYSGRDVPARASDDYVRKVFDDFSQDFEAKLARLRYRAPALIAEALAATGVSADGRLDVLDVGCGTGLCGPLLAPYARRLVGVDLSMGMLDLARAKAVYDLLVQAELTAYLASMRAAWDVIVSADTLVYFGGLEAVAAAAAAALRPGGVVIFTVEEAVDEAGAPYALQPHGRYNHRFDYVERLLAGHGLEPAIGRADLRNESGLPVAGLVVRATKGGQR